MNNQSKNINIIVGLDLSEMDPYLIQYARLLNEILDTSRTVFVHNLKIGELPKELLPADKLAPISKRIQEKLTQQIRNTNPNYTFEVEVKTEAYSELAFMSLAKSVKPDLLVLGNKQHLEGNGGLGQKLVRVLPCSTLLIPETFRSPIHKIVDAIDFSRYTQPVMEWAELFKRNAKGKVVDHSAIHVSKFNWGFFPTMSEQDIKRATQQDMEKRQQEWAKKYANFSDIAIVAAEGKSIASTLLQYAQKSKAEMMILGVKGSTSISDLFMGSVANDLIQRPTDICLLFAKPKKDI
ncbi:universal stress protein [Dyadobacter tibetensis]|uniref:universal stress protein n=1 Tax=Dyadobacter tibetensis TaxID=1211851 RepID=UPI00046FFC9D|nr:universal stress protein [Dyadobacter tibetensis]